jgi:hypothetical protein
MATKHTLWIHVIMIHHIHEKYTVDICLKNSNSDIATRHTQWIYVSVQIYEYFIATWTDILRSMVFIAIIHKYESSHVITCVEVKHGRNYLIIGH